MKNKTIWIAGLLLLLIVISGCQYKIVKKDKLDEKINTTESIQQTQKEIPVEKAIVERVFYCLSGDKFVTVDQNLVFDEKRDCPQVGNVVATPTINTTQISPQIETTQIQITLTQPVQCSPGSITCKTPECKSIICPNGGNCTNIEPYPVVTLADGFYCCRIGGTADGSGVTSSMECVEDY